MVVGEVATGTDVLVIGGGPGGYAAALRAADAGKSVTLIERDRLGGVCLNVGCIPSKALIHAADLAASPAAGAEIGVDLTATVDMLRVQTWMRQTVDRLTGGVEQLLRAAGVTVVYGTARFATPRRVAVWTEPEVADPGAHGGRPAAAARDRGGPVDRDAAAAETSGTGRFFEFGTAIIATGSRPAALPGLPFDGCRVLDSTGALALTEIPARLAVVGGGYIGVELGTALAKLGAHVTIIELTGGLLPGLPRHLAAAVEHNLKSRGVDLLFETAALGLDGTDLVVGPAGPPASAQSAGVPAPLKTGGGPSAQEPAGATADPRPAPRSVTGGRRIPADVVIVATGRRPNTEGLGLEAAGVAVDPATGLVTVDAARRTSRPQILAIGDITPGPALAHKATAEAEVAAATATGLRAAFDPAAVPLVVYSDPEVVTVGLTFEDARAAGADPRTFTFPLSANGRALTHAEPDGHVELVTDPTGTILGAHLAGQGVSELALTAALAVEMAATAEDLALTIAPHPTLSEALTEVALAAAGRPLHFHRRQSDHDARPPRG